MRPQGLSTTTGSHGMQIFRVRGYQVDISQTQWEALKMHI